MPAPGSPARRPACRSGSPGPAGSRGGTARRPARRSPRPRRPRSGPRPSLDLDQRGGDHRVPAGHGDVVDERLVDLEDVDRDGLQQAERRVAGAEVVERDPDAEARGGRARRARPGRRSKTAVSVTSTIRRSAGRPVVGQHARPPRSAKPGSAELAGGDVDADPLRARPVPRSARQLAAWAQAVRRIQSPSSTIRPLCSATGMKSAGLTSPRSGWCQRTSDSDARRCRPSRQLDDRLVDQPELAGVQARCAARRRAGPPRRPASSSSGS